MVLHKRIHKKKIRYDLHVPPLKFESKNENTCASYVCKFIRVTFSLSVVSVPSAQSFAFGVLNMDLYSFLPGSSHSKSLADAQVSSFLVRCYYKSRFFDFLLEDLV